MLSQSAIRGCRLEMPRDDLTKRKKAPKWRLLLCLLVFPFDALD